MKTRTVSGYLREHKKCGIKVGDWVKVLRKAGNHEQGWDNSWISEEMDKFVGKVHRVSRDDLEYGFLLSLDCGFLLSLYYCFPYFVLRKVKGKK